MPRNKNVNHTFTKLTLVLCTLFFPYALSFLRLQMWYSASFFLGAEASYRSSIFNPYSTIEVAHYSHSSTAIFTSDNYKSILVFLELCRTVSIIIGHIFFFDEVFNSFLSLSPRIMWFAIPVCMWLHLPKYDLSFVFRTFYQFAC